MTILEALEEVNDSLPSGIRPQFIYVSSQFEANNLADQLSTITSPVLVILPIIVVDTPGISGVIKTTFELSGFFLTKATGVTVDFTGSTAETTCIAPMRDLARKYIHKLQEHSIIDPETSGLFTTTYTAEYGLWDAHLFGVFVRATVPVMEQVSPCV